MNVFKNIKFLFSNKVFIFIFICSLFVFFIPVLNYYVDPYDIFSGNIEKSVDSTFNRDLIFHVMKNNKDKEYDYVLIGDSNSNGFISYYSFLDINQKTLAKYTLDGLSIEEQYEILKAYLTLHPNIKNVIITLNFISFATNDYNNLPNFDTAERFSFSKITTLLFSIKATKASLEKIKDEYFVILIKKLKNNRSLSKISFVKNYKIKKISKAIEPKFRIETFNLHKLKDKSFYYLGEMITLLDSKNIKPIFIINTVHTYTLVNFYENGVWDNYMEFKKRVAKYTDYYDFSYVNQYNSAPITLENEYFVDCMHCVDSYGLLILTAINNDCENFGYKITSQNVDEITEKQTKLIEDFIINNPDVVREYMKHGVENFHIQYDYEYEE